METIQRSRKSSKFEQDDYISSMPDIVVYDILNRLPLQDAVRTSILARAWRFKWTMLSQLVFDENFYKYLVKTKGEKNYGTIVTWLLLHLTGVITKFVIYIEKETCSVLDDEDVNHWILFLSGKGINDLTFRKVDGSPPLELNTHLFSCRELKHLELSNCRLDPPASFCGFPNLFSLELYNVRLEGGKCGQLFAHCPMLEILKLGITGFFDSFEIDEIAKLTNLKMLTFLLCNLENIRIKSSDIFEIVGRLPTLQELRLDFRNTEFIADGAKKRLPITFSCIKTLNISQINFGCMNSSCAFEIISSFPNLENLEIRESNWSIVPTPGARLPEVDYNTTGRLQLRSVVFGFFIGSEDELRLTEHVLACSPFLKRMVIHLRGSSDSDEKLFAKKLLELHRASPLAEIDLWSF